jgi:uncharacterized membrane protein
MSETHTNTRLEAFCDGVFAIALTLLIIDIKIPEVDNTEEFWFELRQVAPAIFTFVLSFTIILITWVNHHASLRLIHKSTASFIYANGLLLLSVVFLPFPTSLLGEYLFTDHSAPAVMLYNFTMAFQAVGWILLTGTVLKNKLTKSDKSSWQIFANQKFGYFAFILYTVCGIIAFWFPFTIAVITTLTWIFWLVWGIRMNHEA